jgi:ABC-type uncharacterized transport system substrate-binding protein
MKTMLLLVLCGAAFLASGCATAHPRAAAWEYRTDTTLPEQVAGEVAKLRQQGWSFDSMSPVCQSDNGLTVTLLFKRPK